MQILIPLLFFLSFTRYAISQQCQTGYVMTVPPGTKYTKVTTGDATTIYFVDPCTVVSCNGNGVCAAGICNCTGGYSGTNCLTPPGSVSPGSSPSGTTPTPAGPPSLIFYNSPLPKAPVVAYVGGTTWDSTFTFDTMSRVGKYDVLVVGFVNYWNGNCKGPTEPGLGGATPNLWTNACVQTNTYQLPPNTFGACTYMPFQDCRGDLQGGVGKAVLNYQKQGGKVFISIGGANSDVTHMNTTIGVALANAIWNLYLGGEDPRYNGWRPFGNYVVLDGVDLDLEQSPDGCPGSDDCNAVMSGWHIFARTLRDLMDADTRKPYYLSIVPINTKFADPSISFPNYGAYTYGYLPGVDNCQNIWSPLSSVAQNGLATQPINSIYHDLWMIDFVWPQFYPSPDEITMNSATCFPVDLLAWTNMCTASVPPSGKTHHCRVGVGLPFSAGAAGGGQIPAATALLTLRSVITRYPIIAKNFGGIFGWDELWDYNQNGGAYGSAISAGIKNPLFQALLLL